MWSGLEVDMVRSIAKYIFGEDSFPDDRIEFRLATSPDDRLLINSNVDIDFSIGAITDDQKTGLDSRRGRFNIEFTKPYTSDDFAISANTKSWVMPAFPNNFCDPVFFSSNATVIELLGSTGTLEAYGSLCDKKIETKRLSDERRPTSVSEAVLLLGSQKQSFFFSDYALSRYQAINNKNIKVSVKNPNQSTGDFKIAFVVRSTEDGWRELINEAIDKSNHKDICQKYSKYFIKGRMLICKNFD